MLSFSQPAVSEEVSKYEDVDEAVNEAESSEGVDKETNEEESSEGADDETNVEESGEGVDEETNDEESSEGADEVTKEEESSDSVDEVTKEEESGEAESFEELIKQEIADKINEILVNINSDDNEIQPPRTFGMNLTENGGYVWNVSIIYIF